MYRARMSDLDLVTGARHTICELQVRSGLGMSYGLVRKGSSSLSDLTNHCCINSWIE